MKRFYELGFKYERDRGNCVQCVQAAIQDVFSERNDDIFKAAIGFAAGSGKMGTGNCEAYSGGIMALSTKYGRSRLEFNGRESRRERRNNKGKTISIAELVRELHNKFLEEYGSITFKDIPQILFVDLLIFGIPKIGKNLKKPEPTAPCPIIVQPSYGKVAQWTAEILLAS